MFTHVPTHQGCHIVKKADIYRLARISHADISRIDSPVYRGFTECERAGVYKRSRVAPRQRENLKRSMKKVMRTGLGIGAILAVTAIGGLTEGTAFAATQTTAPSGTVLSANQSVTSPSGAARLVMQSDGNLVDYVGSSVQWASYTFASGAYAKLQSDGNLVVYGPSGALWNSMTSGHPGLTLSITDSGVVSLTGPGFTQFEQKIPAGMSFVPGTQIGNGVARLVMQSDGNLVDYVGNSAVWQSGTYGHSVAYASFQTDGNLVVYGPQGGALWASGTNSKNVSSMTINSDGVFYLAATNGNIMWAKRAYQVPGPYLQLAGANVAYAGQAGANIQPYMNGYRVYLIQQKLGVSISSILKGMYVGNTFGKVTAWQSANGFTPNGVIDETQWTRMGFSATSWTSDDNSDHALAAVPTTMVDQSRTQLVEDMVNAAMQYVGNTTFVVGASLQPGTGADCSGLAMQALYSIGLNPLPSSSYRHTQNGYDFESRYLWANSGFEHVSSPQRGDLVFYSINGTVEHMAIYLGNNQVVEGYPPVARVAPLITASADHSHIIGYERPLP